MQSVIIHGVSKINVISETDEDFNVVVDENDVIKVSLEPVERGPWIINSPAQTAQQILIKI
jgi:hypothetical protein